MRILLTLVFALAACAEAQTPARSSRDVQQTPEDSLIFTRTIERAYAERLDTLPVGEIMVRIGEWFVGTPYTPHTIEQPGPEHLVINLREFDCVTFVENMLAFGRTVRTGRRDFGSFKDEIVRFRYRAGEIDGYPSRLHYFSEWIADNDAKGLVENITPRFGVRDPEPLDFMTGHRSAYRQLEDNEVFAEIGRMEARLSQVPRFMIPEQQIAIHAHEIENGDVIAATSNLKGLDVAHTGLAVWRHGELHLMHAPLVGDSVEISERPLAERITALRAQDGIMVARPRD
ncbi:MAG: N-acetylmuramoyl-L-alanine amidase-like domain-containing protein [Gemmatimonadota bacterium]